MKNGNKGRKVVTLRRLSELALSQKSVLWFGSDRPMPAAFAMSMCAVNVHQMIERGLYEYKMPAKPAEAA